MAHLICFRALGGLELTRSSQPVPLRRRQKLALFAVLALSRSSFRNRDSLQAMFWPEGDPDRARKSLNTAIHMLRETLGTEAIISRHDNEIGVADDVVWCDVRAFDAAIAAGDLVHALDLYAGELMEGFFVPGTPGFEHWLDAERERLRRAAHRAAWQLAEQAEQTRDLDNAANWARRAVGIASDDEPGVRHSIGLLDRAGDRMGAIQMYERFAQHLKEEYSTKPAPETRRLVAGILARDKPHALTELPRERLIEPADRPRMQPVEVDEPATAVGATAAGPRENEAPADPPARVNADQSPLPDAVISAAARAHRHLASRQVQGRLAVVAAVVIVVAGLGLTLRSRTGEWSSGERRIEAQPMPDPNSRPRIIISQFETPPADPELLSLATAITGALSQQLTNVSAIEVVTEDAYVGAMSSPSRPEVRTTAAPFFIVRGSMLKFQEFLGVSIELIDQSSGRVLRSARIDRSAADVFGLIDEVARQVGILLRRTLGREVQLRRWQAGTRSVRALELLQRAEVDRRRAKAFEENGIAVAAWQLARADSLLALAEREDPRWLDPIVGRARVARDAAWLYFLPPLHDIANARDWIENGIAHADRALARDTAHAVGLELRGTLYYWSSFMAAPGGVDATAMLVRAENDLRRALSADMERVRAWSILSAILYARGDFAGAYATAEEAYRADTYLEARDEIFIRLALTAHEIGSDSLAWEWCSAVISGGAGKPVSGYCRLHLLAWSDERYLRPPLDPWAIVAEIADVPVAQAMRPHFEMLAATVLARRGLADSARAVAARAARGHPDDELQLFEAGARVALGEADSAAALLRRYVAAEPARRHGIIHSRRFNALDSLLEPIRPNARR